MTVRAEPLQGFAREIFLGLGADEDVAAEVARHLVLANLSGHDSHGVIRIPQYAGEAERGELVPSARPQVISEGPVTALVDSRYGFGHHAMSFALDWCLRKAGEMGLAAAAVRHTNHIGRLGDYAERAAARGFVAIVTVGVAGPGAGSVAPFHGGERFLGTNPWAFGVPAEGRPPFLFDAATSTIAEGKNRLALSKGAQVAEGLLLDPSGRPTTDPQQLYEGGSLTGLGGALGGHKGYGYGLAAALVGGLSMIDDEAPTSGGTMRPPADWNAKVGGPFILVVDPGRFGSRESYAKKAAEVVNAAYEVRPAEGQEGVKVPGDPEVESREARLASGIAIPESTWKLLEEIAGNLGVAVPPA